VYITPKGEATVIVGEEERVVGPGDIASVPAGVPHRPADCGDGPLRQIDIHLSPRYGTERLT
jgi:mannose-6-phosphate isomerase-like protein (cupin superfamily)